MDLIFTDEQEQLRAALRAFLAERSPESEVRRVAESEPGYDPAFWAQLAGELGATALLVPEEYGGWGASFVEIIILFEEAGRTLACAPLLSTVALATTALLYCTDEAARREWLPRIACGELTATLAVSEDTGYWDADGVQLRAVRGPDGWLLDGHKSFVVDGATAELLLVAARADHGVSLFAVESAAAGLRRTAVPTLDTTRRQARLEFERTPARLIGRPEDDWPVVATALRLAAVALAAEQVGGTQQVLETSVEYAKIREQFGRPIGSFQAIKHRCADTLLDVEGARSAAYHAGWTAALDAESLPRAASLAKAVCSQAYLRAATTNIQIHGGIGFTWEHSAHLHFRRAKSSELYLGDAAYHRRLLAPLIGL